MSIAAWPLPARVCVRLFVSAVMIFVGLVVSLPVLIFVLCGVNRKPMKAFSWKKRTLPPAVYLDKSLGKHEVANVNGIQLYYVGSGSTEKPLMLFLHGFPECWYSWRYQLKCQELQDKYRLVAVDLRGYGRSSKPSYFHWAYHRDILVEDVHQLIRALGYDSCVLVAHDWGANIAFAMAREHPEEVDRLVIMDVPEDRIMRSFMFSHLSQIKKSLYMFFFQLPIIPEMTMTLFDYGAMASAFKKQMVNKDRMSADDIEVFKWNFGSRGTLTAGLNYYRNIPSLLVPIILPKRRPEKRYAMPVLVLWGEKDPALDPAMAKLHEDCGFFDDVTSHVFSESAHFLQQELPNEVNTLVLEWLASKESM